MQPTQRLMCLYVQLPFTHSQRGNVNHPTKNTAETVMFNHSQVTVAVSKDFKPDQCTAHISAEVNNMLLLIFITFAKRHIHIAYGLDTIQR